MGPWRPDPCGPVLHLGAAALRTSAAPRPAPDWLSLIQGAAQVLARALPDLGWDSGAPPVVAGSDAGLTSELPVGPATTASPVALPLSHCGQVMNHSVQPLPGTPAR